MVTTISGYPFRRTPINNVTPFTYRDGTTYLEILEGLAHYLNTVVVAGVNDEMSAIRNDVANIVAEAQEYVNSRVDYVDAETARMRKYVVDAVQAINNRVSAPEIQRLSLSRNTTLTVDPTLPNNHILNYIVELNGYELTFDSHIRADNFQATAEGKTHFALIPDPASETWALTQPKSSIDGGDNDILISTLIQGSGSLTRESLESVIDGLISSATLTINESIENSASAILQSIPQVVARALDAESLSEGISNQAKAAISESLSDPASSIRNQVGSVGREYSIDRFPGIMRKWGTALNGKGSRAAVWVALGSSTTHGYEVRPALTYLGRIASFIAGSDYAVAVKELAGVSIRPSTGVQVYRNIGMDSGDYLNASLINSIAFVQPDLITHMIGSNDYSLQRSLNGYVANLESHYNSINAVSPNTVHMYIHQQPRNMPANPTIKWSEYGQRLRQFAESKPNAVFLDVSEAFNITGMHPNMISADDVHLNEQGQGYITHIIASALGIQIPTFVPEYQRMVIPTTSQAVGVETFKTAGTMIVTPARYPRKFDFHFNAICQSDRPLTSGESAEARVEFKYQDTKANVIPYARVKILGGGGPTAQAYSVHRPFTLDPMRAVEITVSINGGVTLNGTPESGWSYIEGDVY